MTTSIDPKEPFPVWEARWQALKVSMEEYRNKLDTSEISDDPSIETLSSMLERLQEFAEKQFHFFYNGFASFCGYDTVTTTLTTPYKLKPSPKYPPVYVLGVVTKQIAYDLEVIQRAAEQRVWALRNAGVGETLRKADYLAKQAVEAGYKEVIKSAYKKLDENEVEDGTWAKPTVITYFEKSHSIRFFPYDHIALIAIPYTCLPYDTVEIDGNTTYKRVTQDYVALLHELGHYAFWHGRVTKDSKEIFIHELLHETLKVMKDNALWCYRWIEEIFADVFGCLMGGPLIALDFQDMALVASAEEFTKDDQEHPVPAIRPTIYINTLKRFSNLWSQTGDLLTTYWNDCKTERFEPCGQAPETTKKTAQPETEFKDAAFRHSICKEVVSGDIVSEVGEVIKRIFEILNMPTASSSISLQWLVDEERELQSFTTKEDVPNLYTLFQNYIDTLPSGSADTDKYKLKTWEEWVDENEFLPSSQDPDAAIEPSVEEPESVFKGWLNVLYADGWATKIGASNPCVK